MATNHIHLPRIHAIRLPHFLGNARCGCLRLSIQPRHLFGGMGIASKCEWLADASRGFSVLARCDGQCTQTSTTIPTVDQINENQPVTDTQLTASYITVSVKPFKGRSITTVELIERSSPTFFDELVRQMEFAYAKDTDSFVASAIQGAGTLNATAKANSATGLLEYIASGAAAVYTASLGFARNLLVTPDQWANIMSYNDAGRPIYNAANPQNAGGAVSPQSLRGTVAGLDLYVSRNFTGSGNDGTADYSMAVINPESYTWYESPRFQLRTNVNSDGTVDLGYYGFGALATKVAAGANWFNKS